ncbi:hypothetical protein AB1Y20_007524 [Prymnesium parvum]|uniref:Pseudouridine synthase RsuA/RluA-like domain-containing protein n=1 Tax=Prymnesium parvum TaxID=97485 RepID=A0AB34IY20_PRYPA
MVEIRAPSEQNFVARGEGDTFAVRWSSSCGYTDVAAIELLAATTTLDVLHEDAEIIVVNKPAYLPCENTATLKDSVRSRLQEHLAEESTSRRIAATKLAVPLPRTLHLPHRLDWETSGLLVTAKTKQAMSSLSRQFAEREVAKVYIADVLEPPPAESGSVILPLSADPIGRPRQQIDFTVKGKLCSTQWKVLEACQTADGTAFRRILGIRI